jgi:hypothetical protein
VLLNGDYEKLLLKMMLLSVICDGYIGWASLDSAGEFFEQEYDFYIICLQIALGKGTPYSIIKCAQYAVSYSA